MKNLIEEIERFKIERYLGEDDYDYGFRQGRNSGVQNVIKLLTQYNLITAPKSIKLSEIVERLTNATKNKFTIGRVQHFIVILFEDEPILRIDVPENKIGEILAECFDDTLNKWLYALWIAGTEIIDDMGE